MTESELGDAPSDLDPAVNSSAWEHVLEHIFLSDLLQEAWFSRGAVVDVLHTSVDAFGYDVVLEHNGVIRHVQLKGRMLAGTRNRYKVNSLLESRPSGCVVWMGWERRPGTNRIALSYRWFGGEPGQPLPSLGSRVATHSKGDSSGNKGARPAIRIVPLGRFETLNGIHELLDRLFGPLI